MPPAKARPSPGKAAPPAAGDDDGLLTIGEEPAEEPRYELLFRLGTKRHSALVNPDGSLLTEYLHRGRYLGVLMAQNWLLERMLSPDAYLAIRTGNVSDSDLRKVIAALVQIVTGTPAPKSPTPGSRSGRR